MAKIYVSDVVVDETSEFADFRILAGRDGNRTNHREVRHGQLDCK